MRVKLIDIEFKGKKPGDELDISQNEAAYLVRGGNAVEVKPKQNKTHGGE
jgi:hypothetical protein